MTSNGTGRRRSPRRRRLAMVCDMDPRGAAMLQSTGDKSKPEEVVKWEDRCKVATRSRSRNGRESSARKLERVGRNRSHGAERESPSRASVSMGVGASPNGSRVNMAASRYEGECKHCGVVASAKDRNEWRELLRLPCCCGQHDWLATTEPGRPAAGMPENVARR